MSVKSDVRNLEQRAQAVVPTEDPYNVGPIEDKDVEALAEVLSQALEDEKNGVPLPPDTGKPRVGLSERERVRAIRTLAGALEDMKLLEERI